MRCLRSARGSLALTSLLALHGCGDTSGPPAPAAVQATGGGGQLGPVHSLLPEPIVATVRDAAGQPVPGWMAAGFALFRALGRPLGRYRPPPAPDYAAPVGARAVRHGRVAETYPDAVFCALLGHRPPPKRTPAGRVARVEALAGAGIVAADGGGLWRLGPDELDACAAACAAWALASGAGSWVGDPREGVIVLPVAQLRDRYATP